MNMSLVDFNQEQQAQEKGAIKKVEALDKAQSIIVKLQREVSILPFKKYLVHRAWEDDFDPRWTDPHPLARASPEQNQDSYW